MKQNKLLQKYIDQRSYTRPMKLMHIITIFAIFSIGFIQYSYAQSIEVTSITYLKDGIRNDKGITYKVDYFKVLDIYDNSRHLVSSKVGDISLATNNSKVIVTDSHMFRDIVFKTPSKDNPNSYDIDTIVDSFKIDSVEMLDGGQLNKYILEPAIRGDSLFTPTLIETSPTTAELKIVMSYYE